MNALIDTHTHLYTEEFDADRELAVIRAVEAAVSDTHLRAHETAAIFSSGTKSAVFSQRNSSSRFSPFACSSAVMSM